MPCRFKISFVPGCKIPAPDATSRNPDDRAEDEENESHFTAALNTMRVVDDIDHAEQEVIVTARSGLAHLHAVMLESVRDKNISRHSNAPTYDYGRKWLPRHAPTNFSLTSRFLAFSRLSAIDGGVITYGNRIVIPPNLRREVCQHLHSAHQGVMQMINRASASIFWNHHGHPGGS